MDAVASHILPTYARVDLAFERGEGCWLISTEGERYLDLTAGIAVNALGHPNPRLVEALTTQAQKLWHVSNLYRIHPDGSGIEQLTHYATEDLRATQPRYTPDGEWIVFTAVTLGSTVAAVPLAVPSFGVRVKLGRSAPLLTSARPAAVSVTLPSPSRA